jgi:hypothetical protein
MAQVLCIADKKTVLTIIERSGFYAFLYNGHYSTAFCVMLCSALRLPESVRKHRPLLCEIMAKYNSAYAINQYSESLAYLHLFSYITV